MVSRDSTKLSKSSHRFGRNSNYLKQQSVTRRRPTNRHRLILLTNPRIWNPQSCARGSDIYLYQEARRDDARREHMVSQLSTAMYLDSLRSNTYSITSPPAWAVTGTDIDRKVSDVALVKGARPLTLLSKEETHQILNAKRAAGVKIDAPPSWVTDSKIQGGSSQENPTSHAQLAHRYRAVLTQY
eukprot:gene17747-20219_t